MSSATRSIFAAVRPAFQSQTASINSINAAARRGFASSSRKGFRFNNFNGKQKRWSSSSTTGEAPPPGWFKRMWDSPIGFKTVHFWAPVMKWCLVLAGISDFARPAEKLSLTQNGALTATGLIWTRWCLIIKPKNYLLAAVNFFLGIVGIVQCTRIVMYNMSQKDGVTGLVEEAKEEATEIKDKAKSNVKAS